MLMYEEDGAFGDWFAMSSMASTSARISGGGDMWLNTQVPFCWDF